METLKEYPCKNCRKVLFFGEITEGKVSKDCPRCGCRNVVTVKKVFTSHVTIELVKKTDLGFKLPPKRVILIAPTYQVMNG